MLGAFYFLRKEFDGVVDGIIYATFCALGFAAVENISYYLKPRDSTLDDAEFVSAVVRESGCKLMLDVNNATDAVSRTYQGNPSNPTGVRYFDWAVNFRIGYSL